MPPSHVEPPTLTRFRQVEKHYKLRQDPRNPKRYYRPSLEDVNLLDDSRSGELSPTGWSECKGRLETFPVGKVAGGDGTRAVKAFGVRSIPGLVILPSYFSPSSQRTLIRSVLSTHTRPPNQTNLDTHFVLPSPSLFSAYASSFYPSLSSSSSSSASCKVPEFPSSPPTEVLVPTRASLPASAGDSTRYVKEQTGRILIENPPGEALGTPEELARGKKREILPIEPSKKVKAKTARELIKELRWTNLGLFYDWTSKSYDFANPIPFPSDIASTAAKEVVSSIDWSQVYSSASSLPSPLSEPGEKIPWETWDDYEPDAGIINFYQPHDTLMGHVDRSELDPYRPLVSVSLGLSAVFLLGGPTRDTPPTPILLQSGDVVVLSGPVRRAYHGVPRVLEGTLPDHLKLEGIQEAEEKEGWKAYEAFLETARININSRQVFPPDFVKSSTYTTPSTHDAFATSLHSRTASKESS